MPRERPEWIGATPDTRVPPHVKLRIHDRQRAACAICTRPLMHGRWDCDHIVPLIEEGENRERNLQAVCNSPCHRDKTRGEVHRKSKAYEIVAVHTGAKKKQRTITVWRKFNGNLVRAPRER